MDIENAIQESTMIECTTTCNHLITWRYDTQIDAGNWYEIIAKNQSGNLCTETIALTPVWAAQSINAVSVQCIAVSVCPSEAQPSCVQGVCLSNIQSKTSNDNKYQIDDTAYFAHSLVYRGFYW